MLAVRRAAERGHANHGWLDTRFSFSFAEYHDPAHMGFRSLRVINDDRVAAGAGFPPHPHRDMEILTYVLDGALEHKDSLGSGAVMRPHDVQRMSAGTGVIHAEFNPSDDTALRLLQIWILPERSGLEPGYEQKAFPPAEKQGRLRLVASPDGTQGSVTIHQDARVYAALLAPGEQVEHALAAGRGAWLQVARGKVALNGTELSEGDGVAIENERELRIAGVESAEVLLFDLK